MVLELEHESSEDIPVHEVGESSPERNFLIPSRARRNVEPPKFYDEKLYKDVIEEQTSGKADNPFTFSEDTDSHIIFENESECREVLVTQSSEQHSPIISHNSLEIVPETRTFTEEEVQELEKKYGIFRNTCKLIFYFKIRSITENESFWKINMIIMKWTINKMIKLFHFKKFII